MKILLLVSALVLGTASVASAEDHAGHSCGQMVASKAVLPTKMAEVMTAVADMFDAHAAIMLASKNKDGAKEAAGLKKIAKNHRDLSTAFSKAAAEMSKAATWPNAPHDMAAMKADAKLGASMQKMLATHKEMIALMQKEVAEMEAMMAMSAKK